MLLLQTSYDLVHFIPGGVSLRMPTRPKSPLHTHTPTLSQVHIALIIITQKQKFPPFINYAKILPEPKEQAGHRNFLLFGVDFSKEGGCGASGEREILFIIIISKQPTGGASIAINRPEDGSTISGNESEV